MKIVQTISTIKELDEKVNLAIVEKIHGEKCKDLLISRLPIKYQSVLLKRGEMSFNINGVDYSIVKDVVEDYAGWKKIKRTVWSTDYKKISHMDSKSDVVEFVNSYLLNDVLYDDEYKSLIEK